MTFRAGHAIRILLAILLLGAALAGEYRSLGDGITAAESNVNPAAASSPAIQASIKRLRHRADLETAAALLAFAAACVSLGTALGSMMSAHRRAWGYLLGVVLCIVTFLVLNLIGVVLLHRFT